MLARMSDTSMSTTPPPAEVKPLLAWYFEAKDKDRSAKTTRDILCLGCLNRCYDFRQERGGLGEVFMTKAEYDAFVAETVQLYDGLVKQHKRITVITHPTFLIGVVIRKPTLPELDRLVSVQGDITIGEDQTRTIFRDDFTQRMLWPAQGSDQMAYLMEEAPGSFGHVLPQKLMEMVGADRIAAKKVG